MTRLTKYPELINGKLRNPARQHRREMERTYEGVLNLKSGRQWKKHKKMSKQSQKVLAAQLDMTVPELNQELDARAVENIEL